MIVINLNLLNAAGAQRREVLTRAVLVGVFVLVCSGCAGPQASDSAAIGQETGPGSLHHALIALGLDVSSDEATLVTASVVGATDRLAREYRMTSPPLLHNVLVNAGLRDKGRCCDWTNDLLRVLRGLSVESLEFKWAVSRFGDGYREHSSVIVLAKDSNWEDGLIVDPWRTAGRTFWVRAGDDHPYPWVLHPLNGNWDALHCAL